MIDKGQLSAGAHNGVEFQIIAVDNKPVKIGGVEFSGRLRRASVTADINVTNVSSVSYNMSYTSLGNVEDWRMALGPGYYGSQTFSISLMPPVVAPEPAREDGELGIKVASLTSANWQERAAGSTDDLSGIRVSGDKIVFTDGEVLLKNTIAHSPEKPGVKKPGVFYTGKYNATTGSTVPGAVTYIIWTNEFYR
jgi:hypothetical protein